MSMKQGPAYTPSAAPSTPLRTKRNFKSLVLDDPIAPDPKASRPAPRPGGAGALGGKKRPPPLGAGTASNGFNPDPTIPSLDSPVTGRRSAMHKTLSNTLAKLDLKAEVPRLDLKNSDLKKLSELGQGNGGSVVKVEHIPSKMIMAMKVRKKPMFSLSLQILI